MQHGHENKPYFLGLAMFYCMFWQYVLLSSCFLILHVLRVVMAQLLSFPFSFPPASPFLSWVYLRSRCLTSEISCLYTLQNL